MSSQDEVLTSRFQTVTMPTSLLIRVILIKQDMPEKVSGRDAAAYKDRDFHGG